MAPEPDFFRGLTERLERLESKLDTSNGQLTEIGAAWRAAKPGRDLMQQFLENFGSPQQLARRIEDMARAEATRALDLRKWMESEFSRFEERLGALEQAALEQRGEARVKAAVFGAVAGLAGGGATALIQFLMAKGG